MSWFFFLNNDTDDLDVDYLLFFQVVKYQKYLNYINNIDNSINIDFKSKSETIINDLNIHNKNIEEKVEEEK